MKEQELYLKTAFCCMACDGEISSEEISLVQTISEKYSLPDASGVEKLLNAYVEEINIQGMNFLNSYLNELASSKLSSEQELKVISIAIDMIEADNKVEYSEISFFKKIRLLLKVSDKEILKVMPDKEDYLLQDIVMPEYDFVPTGRFVNINFSK